MNERRAYLHIHTLDDTLHEVPMPLLCRLGESIQVLAYLTASGLSRKDGCNPISMVDFRKGYQIACCSPESGSFVLPISLKQISTLIPVRADLILTALASILVALEAGDYAGTPLEGLSSAERERFATELVQLVPEKNNAWTLDFEVDKDDGQKECVTLSRELAERASLVLRTEDVASDTDVFTVMGILTSIDFAAKTFRLKLHGNGREVSCKYVQDIPFSTLAEGQRLGMRVTGRFSFDDDGNPVSTSSIASLAPINLDPIVIDSFACDDVAVIPAEGKSVVFRPELDPDSQQAYVVRDETLGIDVYGDTRDDLISACYEQMALNWSEYAKADDQELTQGAQVLKSALLSRFTEKNNAA